MEGNNLIASVKSQWDIRTLNYYAIALPWFRKAFPALTGQRGRDGVGRIRNEPLLGGPTTISTQFLHGVGYLLVGPRTWLLLSQKFGYDKELACRCVYNMNHHKNNNHQDPSSPPSSASTTTPTTARLSFIINQAERVDFVTGRFPYEKYVQSEAVVSDEETTEPEEDDDDDEDDDQQVLEQGEADDEVDDQVRYIIEGHQKCLILFFSISFAWLVGCSCSSTFKNAVW
jgi:hypothetical protein